MSTENVAEKEKQNALKNGLPDPDFDFREYYVKGDELYYVSINDWIGEKEVVKLKLRTIYARSMIGIQEDAGCHVIGYSMKDRLFKDKNEASEYLKQVKVKALYGSVH